MTPRDFSTDTHFAISSDGPVSHVEGVIEIGENLKDVRSEHDVRIVYEMISADETVNPSFQLPYADAIEMILTRKGDKHTLEQTGWIFELFNACSVHKPTGLMGAIQRRGTEQNSYWAHTIVNQDTEVRLAEMRIEREDVYFRAGDIESAQMMPDRSYTTEICGDGLAVQTAVRMVERDWMPLLEVHYDFLYPKEDGPYPISFQGSFPILSPSQIRMFNHDLLKLGDQCRRTPATIESVDRFVYEHGFRLNVCSGAISGGIAVG